MPNIDEHHASAPAEFALRTPDPSAVTGFYVDLFGWLTDGEGGFVLDERRVARVEAATGGWVPYLAVEDLDVALKSAFEAGATGGESVTDKVGRRAIVVEPGGASLGLWQIGSGSGIGVMGEPGTVVWLEQKTHRQADDTAFLAEVFGFEVLGPEGPGKVRVLKGDGPLFGGVMQFDARWAADEAPHWLLYFAVDDVEVFPALAARLGGSVWFPPFDTPLGRMAYLRDPSGNAFAVVTVSSVGRGMTGGHA